MGGGDSDASALFAEWKQRWRRGRRRRRGRKRRRRGRGAVAVGLAADVPACDRLVRWARQCVAVSLHGARSARRARAALREARAEPPPPPPPHTNARGRAAHLFAASPSPAHTRFLLLPTPILPALRSTPERRCTSTAAARSSSLRVRAVRGWAAAAHARAGAQPAHAARRARLAAHRPPARVGSRCGRRAGSLIICIYYNVILCWAWLYFFSMRADLPWSGAQQRGRLLLRPPRHADGCAVHRGRCGLDVLAGHGVLGAQRGAGRGAVEARSRCSSTGRSCGCACGARRPSARLPRTRCRCRFSSWPSCSCAL